MCTGVNAGFVVVATIWIAFAVIGGLIGNRRGQADAGVLLGVLLGPIGWLITAFLPMTPEAEAKHRSKVNQIMGTSAESSLTTQILRPAPQPPVSLPQPGGPRRGKMSEPAAVKEPGRIVFCNLCGTKLKLPTDGPQKPGDQTNCPRCGALVAVYPTSPPMPAKP